MLQAMRVLGRHFVLGQTIEAAIRRAREPEQKGYRYSYDMLGEAARTDGRRRALSARLSRRDRGDRRGGARRRADGAARHLDQALGAAPALRAGAAPPPARPSCCRACSSSSQQARAGNIAVTIDAEESERLEPSLDLFERLAAAPGAGRLGRPRPRGPGLSEARDPRHRLARGRSPARERRRIPVRLVKGAYWDSEIKRAQEQGLDDYPVFTRKLATDVSYLACARRLLAGGEAFYPQFATHNAQTLASIVELAGDRARLRVPAPARHGRGALRGAARRRGAGASPAGSTRRSAAIRTCCPTWCAGCSRTAPTPRSSIASSTRASRSRAWSRTRRSGWRASSPSANPRIPLPPALYGAERRNSRGIDLARSRRSWSGWPERIAADFAPGLRRPARRRRRRGQAPRPVPDPADRSRARRQRDRGRPARPSTGARARPARGFAAWDRTPRRGSAPRCLERAADLYEANAAELLAWCVREAGKTLADAVAEVREAVDFLRYYAVEAQAEVPPRELPGPTGESNRIALHGRGVFVAISPWNFPLAIFTGQIAAALVVGNAVLAKPAPQTPLIAARAVALLHRGGRARGRLDPAAGRAGGRRAAWSRARASPASPSPARPQTAWRDQPRARRQGRADPGR